jgi:MSHA biogenesis protein MshN
LSLINQMLRDLDQREASSLERGGLSPQVRALPRERHFPWAAVLPLIVGTAIAAGGIWWAHEASMPVPEHPPVPATPAPATLTMPTLIVPMPAEQVEAAPAPVANEAAAVPLARVAEAQAPQLVEVQPAPLAKPAPAVVSTPAQIDKKPLVQPTETADGEYRKALAAYRQAKPAEAAEGLQAALRLDPRHVAARQALLSVLLEQRRLPEAQATATEGLALLPAQPGWAMILARLQVEQGQLADAERTMAAYEPYGERSADYLAFHGLLLEKLQRPQEARAVFQKARDLGNLTPELAAAIDQRLR